MWVFKQLFVFLQIVQYELNQGHLKQIRTEIKQTKEHRQMAPRTVQSGGFVILDPPDGSGDNS